ncbi:MAG: MBOAT family protein [Muribaculaceae bacterium]|nr:MBOAT family protein [Muribaculaceae bacterium]
MIFNSFQFVWLFPLIFVLYWGCSRLWPGRRAGDVAKYFLLAVSYGLYAQWSVPYTLILFGVTLVTFFFALLIERRKAFGRKKYIIWAGVSLTLFPLLVFKYFNFITGAGASVLQWIGIDAAPPALEWVVPLGLSFYTFQALGYLWDVYYAKIKAERNFGDYMLFVAFFPQILCGPISRPDELLPQIKSPREFDYTRAVSGLKYLLWGMFLKVVLADRLGIYVDTIYAEPLKYSGSSSLLASICYSLQIYGDFAGYSFMALGVARLLGFDIIKNFNRPYLATSVSAFWKRWNISLTRWLTTYIYIPLGGSRCGKLRTYRNIMLTFLVSGIWHGANWTFIFWGVIHGAAQCVEKFLGWNMAPRGKWSVLPRILFTFVIVNFAWIFFRLPTIGEGWEVIRHIFSSPAAPYIHPTTFFHLAVAVPIVVAADVMREFTPGILAGLNRYTVVRWSAYVILLTLILTFGVLDSGQFIYVSF